MSRHTSLIYAPTTGYSNDELFSKGKSFLLQGTLLVAWLGFSLLLPDDVVDTRGLIHQQRQHLIRKKLLFVVIRRVEATFFIAAEREGAIGA